MPRKLPRFFLTDLVAMIALCGLAFGLLQSLDKGGKVAGFSVMMLTVFTVWTVTRVRRDAPTCAQCGKRFIGPQKTRVLAAICPQCGHQEQRATRMRRKLAIGFWTVLALLVLDVVVMTSVNFDGISSLPRSQATFYLFALPITMILLCSLCAVLGIAFVLFDYGPLKPISCEKCGAVVPREKATGPLLCPQCRLQDLPRKQAKIEGAKGILVLFAALSIVGMLAGLILGGSVGSSSGVSFWTILPLSIVATIIMFFAVLFARIPRIGLRAHRLKNEPYVLKLAARCAGEDGEVARSGTTTVWWSGPPNPAPQILEQMESTRGRLQQLTGSEIISPPFLRIVVCHKRSGFDEFVGPFTIAASYYVKYIRGLYFGAPHRILALCGEELRYAASDHGQTIQLHLCSHFRESLPGSPLANWVQEGLGKCLSGADHDLGPLNRKMLASLARGDTFGTRLFEIRRPELLQWLRGFSDHKNFERVMQFQAESWSVFEYLGGRDAPPERRDCLRAFLADREAQARPASLFERHFLYGLDRLVENWRKWVDNQGIGISAAPFTYRRETAESGHP